MKTYFVVCSDSFMDFKKDWLKQCNQTDSVWLTFTRHLIGTVKTRYSIDRVNKLLSKERRIKEA